MDDILRCLGGAARWIFSLINTQQQLEEEEDEEDYDFVDEEDYAFVDDYDDFVDDYDDIDGSGTNENLFNNKWRKEAGERAQLMKYHFKKRNDFRNARDYASAKKHDKLALGYIREMEEANRRAVKYIMETNEKNTLNQIDLHGLHVDEALEELEKKLRGRMNVLYIITGQGIHSKDKIPKIKPAVENYLKENNYVFKATNPGRLAVRLS